MFVTQRWVEPVTRMPLKNRRSTPPLLSAQPAAMTSSTRRSKRSPTSAAEVPTKHPRRTARVSPPLVRQRKARVDVGMHQALAPAPAAPTGVVKLDATMVGPSPWNSRDAKSFGDSSFQSLCADIVACGGNLVPIKVRPNPTTGVGGSNSGLQYEVVYGHRRHRACLVMRLPVAAIVEDLDELAVVRDMVTENDLHNPPSALEQGRLYCQMLEAGLFPSMRRMAEFLRRDAGDVSRAMTLARLPEPLLQAMTDPRALALHDASRLNALIERGGDSVLENAAKLVERQGRITPKALMRCLEASLTPATADAPQAEPATITVQGRAVGSVQVDHSGGLTIKVSAVIPRRRHGEVKKKVANFLQRLLE